MKTLRQIIKETEEPKAHPFELSGLGLAPFRLIGVVSMPARSLAEANPTAYNRAVAEYIAAMRHFGVQGGICQHCGTAIMNNYIIRSADSKNSVVGSQCVEHTGDVGLGNAVAVEKRRLERNVRREKAEARREVARQKWLEANKDRLEAEAKAREAALAAQRAAGEKIKDKWAFMLPFLDDPNGYSFKSSIARSIQQGDEPRGRAVDILKDIYAKAHGRRGSKDYNSACDEFFEKIG